jgi:phosphatidylglycerol:prolipoprotein diacylglycerol transferase
VSWWVKSRAAIMALFSLHMEWNPDIRVVLYESIAYLTLQFVMLYLFKIYKDNKPASYSVVMLVGIFGLRFLIEFFKEPEGMIFFGTISKTQMLNVPFILLGVAIFILMRTRKLTYNT